MIAACPECRTQYRVDPQQLSDEGVRLRCTRCQTIFRVRAPQAAAPAAPAPTRAPAASREEAAAAPVETPVSAPGETTPLSERLVLVATPDAENAKRWCETLHGWGLEAESAHDGVEAILKVHRRWPAAVVLDPQLPKMFGFQVCEVIKRNDSLRRIGVVLIGAIHHPQRYRRSPSELYGADAYIEEPDLPEALAPVLRDLGLPIGPAPVVGPPPAASAPAPETPTLPPPVPAEATLPPVAPAETTVPPVPPAETTVPPVPPAETTMPPAVPAETTMPPVAPAETAMPPVAPAETAMPPVAPAETTMPPVPSEATLPPVPPAPEPAPAAPAAARPVEELAVRPPEASLASAVAEPAPAEPAGPAIGSPDYDVVDPDSLPLATPEPQAAVTAEPEPDPAPAPVAAPPPPAPAPSPPAPEPVAAPPSPAPEPVAAPPSPAPEPVPEPVAPRAPQPAPAAAASAPEPAVDPEVEQAERLARIIISDVVLYNEEKFRAACQAGNVLEALEGDLADGRAHFASRVPEHVRNARDFLADELMRVAKSRGLA